MNQLVQPNLSAVGRITYCLEYASRLVFQNPAGGTTAWNAWLVCEQHEDQNFPPGVSFPVWFSGAGGAGHVAVFTPQGIYSSPYNQLTGHAVLSSISEVERIYSVKYVGWSPDILNLKVIGEDMGINQGELSLLTSSILNRQPVPGDNGYLGRNWQEVATEFYNSGEHKSIIEAADRGNAPAPAPPNAVKLAPGIYDTRP